MSDAFLSNFLLLDRSAYVVIAVIVLVLTGAIAATLVLRAHYRSLAHELRRSGDGDFRAPVLVGIVHQTLDAYERGADDINTQAIVEHNFQLRLKPYIVAERFIKASTG